MSDKNISSSEKFKAVRTFLNITQSEFAAKLGIGQSYYSAIETGVKQPSVHVMDSLFGLGVSADWYYNGIGDIMINIRDNSNIPEISELVETNRKQLTQYYCGSELKPFNYEYLQIKHYEQFNMGRINELIDSDCQELESVYNSYVKLVEVMHYLGAPKFLLEKFRQKHPFTSEMKDLIEEYNEEMDVIGLHDEKLKRILYLMTINNKKEDLIYCIKRIADYMFLYKDMILGEIIDNNDLRKYSHSSHDESKQEE